MEPRCSASCSQMPRSRSGTRPLSSCVLASISLLHDCIIKVLHWSLHTTLHCQLCAAYPVITHLSGSTVVPEYAAEVTLRCSADGDPPPSIRWTRQGNKTERQARPDGSLVLSVVQSSDAGTYVCTATNIWGTDSNSTALSVFSKSIVRRVSVCLRRERHLGRQTHFQSSANPNQFR